MQGRKLKQMGIQKYIGRVKEAGRTQRRHSSFYIGLYGESALLSGFPSRRQLRLPVGSNLGQFYGWMCAYSRGVNEI